jgi:four helix bundle protein
MAEYALDRLAPEVAHLTLRIVRALPDHWIARELGRQLLRSGTGVAANYRAAKRAQSAADLIAKLKKVEEEADESILWVHLLKTDTPATVADTAEKLSGLCNEATALAVAAVRTTRRKIRAKRAKRGG